MDQPDFELLERIEQGGHVFKPADRSGESREAFQETVDQLLRLRAVGLISFPDGRIMRAEDGTCLMIGPCDLTPAAVAALARDRRLGPRPPHKPTPEGPTE